MDSLTVYDALYALAADDGRADALFGRSAPLARRAFARSTAGEEFPLVWFEVPLTGRPRFNLYVTLSHAALSDSSAFASGAANGYDELFSWYASRDESNCPALVYDVGDGRIDNPAVHVCAGNAPLADMERLFELASSTDTARRYRGFVSRLPQGWRVRYASMHPGRPCSPIRIDCLVDRGLQDAYACDVALLVRDLRSCGFAALGPTLIELATPILSSPFGLDLQFDVMRAGKLGSTLGLAARFPHGTASSMRALFGAGGAGGAFFGEVERLGLADARWSLVPDTAFAQLVPLHDGALALHSTPACAKLRMRDGTALDASTFLQAGAAAQPAG